MYVIASALHASEPSHLAFGKLMYRDFKLAHHVVITHIAHHVTGQILVLKSVVYQVVGSYSLLNQPAHLIDHSRVKTGFKTSRYAFAPRIAVNVDTYNRHVAHGMRLGQHRLVGMLAIVVLNLNRAYGPLAAVDIGSVVQNLYIKLQKSKLEELADEIADELKK